VRRILVGIAGILIIRYFFGGTAMLGIALAVGSLALVTICAIRFLAVGTIGLWLRVRHFVPT
jgi:hypothetical protein